MNKVSRILVTAITGVLLSSSLCFAAHNERVHVMQANHNSAIIRTNNGAEYQLRLGHGCPSLKHYVKQDVVVRYTNKFLGNGSSVILAKDRQQCTINSFARIKGPNAQRPEPRKHP